MSEVAVEIRDLRVDYDDFVAVSDLSLTVPRGEVMGWVGPNGAGKTSTFRVMTMLMEPTYGEVRLGGFDIVEDARKVRKILGYMPDMAPVPTDLKVWEFLDFYAHAHKLGSRKARGIRVDECLETVNLCEKRNSFCKDLSRGQTQRLILAKTLLHRPEVLVLDEPASGLDPVSRRELRKTVQHLASEGATVLISSHILSELDEMCSSLCILNQGRLIATGTAAEIRAKFGDGTRRMILEFLGEAQPVREWLSDRPRVSNLNAGDQQVGFHFTGTPEEQAGLIRDLVVAGFNLRTFSEEQFALEEILEQTSGEGRT
jgi:ABC-2 type transport system ATP-binding protein|tara:strand:- start:790 stop:1734 length:945 start_codon:yes stop_codon:yes gene_type:complete